MFKTSTCLTYDENFTRQTDRQTAGKLDLSMWVALPRPLNLPQTNPVPPPASFDKAAYTYELERDTGKLMPWRRVSVRLIKSQLFQSFQRLIASHQIRAVTFVQFQQQKTVLFDHATQLQLQTPAIHWTIHLTSLSTLLANDRVWPRFDLLIAKCSRPMLIHKCTKFSRKPRPPQFSSSSQSHPSKKS